MVKLIIGTKIKTHTNGDRDNEGEINNLNEFALIKIRGFTR